MYGYKNVPTRHRYCGGQNSRQENGASPFIRPIVELGPRPQGRRKLKSRRFLSIKRRATVVLAVPPTAPTGGQEGIFMDIDNVEVLQNQNRNLFAKCPEELRK